MTSDSINHLYGGVIHSFHPKVEVVSAEEGEAHYHDYVHHPGAALVADITDMIVELQKEPYLGRDGEQYKWEDEKLERLGKWMFGIFSTHTPIVDALGQRHIYLPVAMTYSQNGNVSRYTNVAGGPHGDFAQAMAEARQRRLDRYAEGMEDVTSDDPTPSGECMDTRLVTHPNLVKDFLPMSQINETAQNLFLDQVSKHVLSVEQQVQPEEVSPEAFRVRSIEQAVTGVLAILDGTAPNVTQGTIQGSSASSSFAVIHRVTENGADDFTATTDSLVSGRLANTFSGHYSHLKASYLKGE